MDSLEEESTSIPDDMNELMEWVFGEHEADTANEEESEEDTEHLKFCLLLYITITILRLSNGMCITQARWNRSGCSGFGRTNF